MSIAGQAGEQGGKAALGQHGADRGDDGGLGHARDLAAKRDAADAEGGKVGHGGAAQRAGGKGVDGFSDRSNDLRQFCHAGRDRDVEEVRPCRLERLQAADALGQIIAALHHAIGAGTEDEGVLQARGRQKRRP